MTGFARADGALAGVRWAWEIKTVNARGLDVRVQIAPGLTDFAREDVDVAIRSGHGRYPGLRVDFLMDESFFPVCSAALLGDPRVREAYLGM